MTRRGSTPLVASPRRRERKIIPGSVPGKEPLIYFAHFSGRPGDVTIGLTSGDLSQDREPRLESHERAAGKVVSKLWARGGYEVEQRLHRCFPEEQYDNTEWFRLSERLQAYLEGLIKTRFASPDWKQACVADYLRYWPLSDRGLLGQMDIYGGITEGGVEIEDLDDYQTPPLFVEANRLVLMRIDLDPATSERANDEVVQAKRIHIATRERDGLTAEWHGTTHLNPPWSQDGLWAQKLLEEYRAGHVEAAVLCLGTGALEKVWWQDFGPFPMAISIGRPAWRQYDGSVSPPAGAGGVFIYLGPDEKRFASVYSVLGHVYGSRKQWPYRGGRVGSREQWDPAFVRDYWDQWRRRLRLG